MQYSRTTINQAQVAISGETSPEALAERRRLGRIERDLQEAFQVSFSPTIFADDQRMTPDEITRAFEEADGSLKQAVDIYEKRHALPEAYSAPNDLVELIFDAIRAVDPECVRESRRQPNMWAFLTRATEMRLQSHRVRLHLLTSFPDLDLLAEPQFAHDFLTKAAKLGITIPELDVLPEEPTQWSRNQSIQSLRDYCLKNDYLPVFSTPERHTDDRYFGFADVRVMPSKMARLIFSTGTLSGLDKTGYANMLFTPSSVDKSSGLPLWRVVEHLLLEPAQMDAVCRVLGRGGYTEHDGDTIGDGYGFSFPPLYTAQDVRLLLQPQGITIGEKEAESRARRYNQQVMRDGQIRWAATAVKDDVVYPAAQAKGTIIPMDEDAVRERIADLTDEDRSLFAEAITLLETAVDSDMEVVFLVKGDQVKIGADRVPAHGISYLAMTNTLGPNVKDGPINVTPASFENVHGSSQQIMFTEFSAYGDLLRHITREIDQQVVAKMTTPRGIRQLAGARSTLVYKRGEGEGTGTPVAYAARDLVEANLTSGLIRLDGAGSELEAQGLPVPAGHLEMPRPVMNQVNKLAGEAIARVCRTFGAFFQGQLNHTCESSRAVFLAANGYETPRVWTNPNTERPQQWESTEWQPTFELSSERTLRGERSARRCFSAEPEIHQHTHWELDLLPDEAGNIPFFRATKSETATIVFDRPRLPQERRKAPLVFSRGVTFLPKIAANVLNADDDGDMIFGMAAPMPSGVKETFSRTVKGQRPRMLRTEQIILEATIGRYPGVDAPTTMALPLATPCPWWATGKDWKEQQASYQSYLNIFRFVLPVGADVFQDTIVQMESNRTIRLADEGATADITKNKIDGPIALDPLLNHMDRKWGLNAAGRLTRNQERFLALEQQCYIRAKHKPDEAANWHEVASEYRNRARGSAKAIERELKALKYHVPQEAAPRLKLFNRLEAQGFGFETNAEVRAAVSLDYHNLIKQVRGALGLFGDDDERGPSGLTIEDLMDPATKFSGFGKETAVLNAALAGHYQGKQLVAGGAGRRLLETLRGIQTDLWPFVNDLKKQVEELSDEEVAQKERLLDAIDEWRTEWANFMEEKNESMQFNPSDENEEIWTMRAAHRYTGMRRYMEYLGSLATRQALLHAILEDWTEAEDKAAEMEDGERSRLPSIAASMALLGRRAGEIFPVHETRKTLPLLEGLVRTLPVYAKEIEIRAYDLPGRIGDFVRGHLRYDATKGLFLLHHDSKVWPLHLAERASDTRPPKDATLRFFRIRRRSGIVLWS